MLNSQIIIKYSRTRLDACNHARSASCIYNCIPPTTRSFFFSNSEAIAGIPSFLDEYCWSVVFVRWLWTCIYAAHICSGYIWKCLYRLCVTLPKIQKTTSAQTFHLRWRRNKKEEKRSYQMRSDHQTKMYGGACMCVSVCVCVGIYLSERNMTAPRRLHKTIWVEARK